MRLRKQRASGISPDTDMTPMIDMCFQLIAFFAIAINFAGADQDLSVRVPASELAKPPDESTESTLTLQVRADGQILFGGNAYELAGIEVALNRQARVMERLNQRPADTSVVIRGDRETKAGYVQELIKHCQAAGFESFSLKAKQEKAGG